MYSSYRPVTLIDGGTTRTVGTGWLPPLPDLRDYTDAHPKVEAVAKRLRLASGAKRAKALPASVDLRQWCSPVEDQGELGSCTAHAAVGIVEYFERRAFSRHIEGSRLFVYKATRNLMNAKGDTGAFLRNAMGALVLCGVPDEKYWPYTDHSPEFDREPPAFVYAVADNYSALSYFSHDPLGGKKRPPADVLASVKKYLAVGVPAMFGFWGFGSSERADVPGGIPYPCPGEKAEWGHAIAAVGYDDRKKIKNLACNMATTGALLIRNSWGKTWGDGGYGWLPYQYVLDRLADDFWSLIKLDWVETGQFGI